MGIFLKRVTRPQEGPQAGPSEGVAEGDIAIIGGDSSMCLVIPGDLPVGQEVKEEKDSDIADPDPWVGMFMSYFLLIKKFKNLQNNYEKRL